MVVSATLTTKSYTGDGSTTEFPTVFVFKGTGASAELTVVERVIATGAETTKTYSTHYTVSGGSGSTMAYSQKHHNHTNQQLRHQ